MSNVDSRIVSLPATTTPPSLGSTRVDWNVISGAFSTSKKSGERRCASRCSFCVTTLAVRIVPYARLRQLEDALEVGEAAVDDRDPVAPRRGESDRRVNGIDAPGSGGKFDASRLMRQSRHLDIPPSIADILESSTIVAVKP